MTGEEEGVDNFERCPVEIIHEVQSRLPVKDAAKTSLLSRKWQTSWASRRAIHLDEKDFGADFSDGNVRDPTRRDYFLNYLEKFWEMRSKLQRSEGWAVDTIFIQMTVEGHTALVQIRRWIIFSLKNKLRKLRLGLRTPYGTVFDLGKIRFSAEKTLLELEIVNCDISNCSFMLPGLNLLILDAVVVEDTAFKSLMAACPRIEKLIITHSQNLKYLVVPNSTLNYFRVAPTRDTTLIRIESPNLEYVQFDTLWATKSCGNCEVDITSPTKVRMLRFLFVNDLGGRLSKLINKFPLLEELVIDKIIHSKNLVVSQPNLDRFLLNVPVMLKEIKLNAPKLNSFKYSGHLTLFSGIEASRELDFVQFRLIPRRLNGDWYTWIRDTLDSFAHSKHLRLICKNEEDIIFPSDLNGTLPPIYDLKNLELQICSSTATSQQILDGLIWILPDLKTLSLTLGSNSEVIELLDNSN